MTSEHYTDEQISAWVDGELDADAAASLQAWLAQHPEAAARARAWAADRDALRAHLRAVLDEPVPPALRAVLQADLRTAGQRRPGPQAWRGWALAAGAAGVLLTGALLGGAGVGYWHQQEVARLQAHWAADLQLQLAAAPAPGSAQGWVQRAALAHSVYVPEPRHAVEVKAQEEHLARWLTRRVDVPVRLFNLQAQGFELIGGRLLPDGPGKSAQLMYQDAQGRRVTVYLRKPDQPTETEFRYERQGEIGLFYWIEEGCGYALVGALPRETLLALAEAVYDQHPKPGVPALPAAPAPPAPGSKG